MTADAICVAPETPIREAERIFEKHDFNGLPVVDAAGALVGVVTKLDLLAAFCCPDDQVLASYERVMDAPVSSAMTRDVRTVCPRTPLARALEKMVDAGVKSFPVVDGDRLVGVVAREDVLRALRRATSGLPPARAAAAEG